MQSSPCLTKPRVSLPTPPPTPSFPIKSTVKYTSHPYPIKEGDDVCMRAVIYQLQSPISSFHNHTPKEIPTCLSAPPPHGNKKPSQTSTRKYQALRTRGYRPQKKEEVSEMPFSTYITLVTLGQGSIRMALLKML